VPRDQVKVELHEPRNRLHGSGTHDLNKPI